MSSSLNGILGRIPYLARRLKEGGASFLLLKVREKAVQAFFWPICKAQRLGLLPRPRSEVSEEFVRMGEDIAKSIASHHGNTPRHRDAQRIRLQKIKSGLFPVLGFGDLEIPSGQAWLTDQLSGVSWPNRYFTFVPLVYSDDRSDIKVVWELSRLQYLMWIAESVVVTEGPERDSLVTRFVQIVEDWDENNPRGYGPNWKCSMEVSIRAINLALSSAVIWEHLDDPVRERIVSMLSEHRRHLRKFPERSDVSGNHLLFDLIGEVVLDSVVFDAQKSLTRVLRDLDIELQSQFYEDGLHFENAVAYHRFVMEGLTLATAVLVRIGAVEQITPLLAVMNRGVTALRKLATVNCKLPVIGDCDSGQILAYSAPEQSITYVKELVMGGGRNPPILSAIAGDMRSILSESWLARIEIDLSEMIGPYVKVRIPRIDLLMRAGPHGLLSRATHDHDDNGSPWVCIDGVDFLTEQGSNNYTRSLSRRLENISSRAHNLFLPSGIDRFEPATGSISTTVMHSPISKVERQRLEHGSWSCLLKTRWTTHLSGRIEHLRQINASSADGDFKIEIEDVCRAPGVESFDAVWHIGTDWSLVHRVNNSLIFKCGAMRVRMFFDTGQSPIQIIADRYWHSANYGAQSRGTRIIARVSGDGCGRLATILVS